MDAYGQEMKGHSQKMDALGGDMARASAGMQALPKGRDMRGVNEGMAALGQKMEMLGRKMAVTRDDAERERIGREMEQTGARMEAAGRRIEDGYNTPQIIQAKASMKAIGRQMEGAGQPMEALGKKMGVLGKQMERESKAGRYHRARLDPRCAGQGPGASGARSLSFTSGSNRPLQAAPAPARPAVR